MPLGIQNDNFIANATLRFGDHLAKSIQQAGVGIEQSIERVATNRQLQGLGETLSQINPETPDYPQQLMKLRTQFPLAAQDPRGYSMVGLGMKSYLQWQQNQQQIQRATTQFGRQKQLIAYRNANPRPGSAANGEVDLLTGQPAEGLPEGGGVVAPGQLAPQNPATRAGFSFGSGMGDQSTFDTPTTEPGVGFGGINPARSSGFGAGQAPMEEPAPSLQTDESSAIMGGGAARNADDPLVARALGPLREAQRITGVKPTKKDIAKAIADERRAANQSTMQEDRQEQQNKIAADRRAADEKKAERAETIRKTKADLSSKKEAIKSRLSAAQAHVKSAESALLKHKASLGNQRAKPEFYARQKELEATVEAAGAAREKIQSEFEALSSLEADLDRPEGESAPVKKFQWNGSLVPK